MFFFDFHLPIYYEFAETAGQGLAARSLVPPIKTSFRLNKVPNDEILFHIEK